MGLALGCRRFRTRLSVSRPKLMQFCAQPLTFTTTPRRTRPATRIFSSPPTGTGRANAASPRHAPRGWLGARRGCIRGILSAHHRTPRPASEQFPLPIPSPSGPSSLPPSPRPAMSSMRSGSGTAAPPGFPRNLFPRAHLSPLFCFGPSSQSGGAAAKTAHDDALTKPARRVSRRRRPSHITGHR